MFTQSLITHQYVNADGTPSSGEIVFTLQEAMTNGSVTISNASRVTGQLDSTGFLSQVLTSTDDPSTAAPGQPLWRVDERVAGASVRTYDIRVPSGGASADLSTLMPFYSPPEPGGDN